MSSAMLPAQRVPAWKRLGLKLKPASESQSEGATDSTSTPAASASASASGANGSVNATKRKPSGAPASDHAAKKARNNDVNFHATPQTPLSKKKSVSFAAEPVEHPAKSSTADGKPATKKQKKQKPPSTNKPDKTPASKQAANLGPAVDYLRQWKNARDQWKFNKNSQSKLLENVFADGSTIPAVDINIFYEYIRSLKGYVRTRLRERAVEHKQKDMEAGTAGFPTASKEVGERKLKEYDGIIDGFMREGRTKEKRGFEEVDFVLSTTDMEIQRRVVKRMRAEVIVDELDDSEDTAGATTSTSATTSELPVRNNEATDSTTVEADDDKSSKSNEAQIRRKRKARTAAVEDTSSSESESESESDSDASSSDSSSEESDEEERGPANNANDASSSSSSSSSSDSDSSDDE